MIAVFVYVALIVAVPLASVDSVNVSRNYKDQNVMPGRMADRIDRVNGPFAPPPAWSVLL